MNSTLFIFGAGDGAIELLENFDGNQLCKYFQIFCVVDKIEKKFLYVNYEYMLPTIKHCITISYKEFKERILNFNYKLINSVMDCDYKERIYLENKERDWAKFILGNSTVLCKLQIGTIIMPQVFIGSTVELGKFVKVNHGAKLLVNSSVGDYSFIGTNSMLLANSKVGSKTLIYSGVTILPNINIGNNTVIGAGSVVTKDIGDNVVAYGNPCKVVRENEG